MPTRKKTLGIVELLDMFPDEESARKWFEYVRWSGRKRHRDSHIGELQLILKIFSISSFLPLCSAPTP